MKKDARQLTSQIMALVEELAALKVGSSYEKQKKFPTKYKGATGGIRFLVDEGFFDSPQPGAAVIAKLKQEGRHYPRASIMMGLLNLVRGRVLTRIPDGKNYNYVIRK